MAIIYDNLHQFSSYVSPIDLTFHQYLLLIKEPILFHTGDVEQTKALIPHIISLLGEKDLGYIFISHFESDECGGLSLMLDKFPDAKPLCSEITARQLKGFGITDDVIIKKPGDRLTTGDYDLEFISYPSEMHLWEGLLVMEHKRGIFFSSDLMFRLGKAGNEVTEGNWREEVGNISYIQIPDTEKRTHLRQTLMELNPKFVATGHGPCIRFL